MKLSKAQQKEKLSALLPEITLSRSEKYFSYSPLSNFYNSSTSHTIIWRLIISNNCNYSIKGRELLMTAVIKTIETK